MRAIGWFNVAYGSLGLACSALLAFVMPVNPLAPRALALGAAASLWTAVAGVVMIVWGPKAISALRTRAASLLRRGPRV